MSPNAARIARWFVLVVSCAPLLGSACKAPLGEPLAVPGTPAPFERRPYLQAVDSSSAVIQWLASAEVADSARWRVASDSVWRALAVQREEGEVEGEVGPLVRRRARIDGVEPGTPVEYQVWAGDDAFGPVTFRTAPGEAPETVRLLAFGDSGWGSAEQFTLARLMDERAWDLIVHTGDIAYNDGSEQDFSRRHFAVYRSLLARTPFFPSAGNHDLRSAGGKPYHRAFTWNADDPGARYYTFRWGAIQFIALDTTDEGPDFPDVDVPEAEDLPGEDESDGRQLRAREGRQFQWLATRLEEIAEDPTITWTIVFMHHPPYSHAIGFSGHGPDIRLRRAIAPLFDRYGVDLVLSGHDHHYERTHPLRNGRRVEPGCGPLYLVTGGGGASRFARGIARSDYLAASSRTFHFLEIEIHHNTLDLSAIDQQGRVIDRVFAYPYAGTDAGGAPRAPGC